jgi:hypothetical protein
VLVDNPELIREVHLDYFAPARRWRSPPAIRPPRRALPPAGWMKRSRRR